VLSLLVCLCALLAVLPLLRVAGSRWVPWAAGLAVAGIAAASFAYEPPQPVIATTRPLVQPTDGYLGSAGCRSCHPAEHASWHDSYHRTMTQVATRATVAAQFDELQLDWFGSPVVLQWRGETLWVDFERRGARPGRVQRPIEQLTGSHHLQVLWYSTGQQRELAPVPMVYKLAEQLWLPLSAVFILPPEYRDPPEPGTWNQNCHMCHATHARPRVDIGRCDTEVSELGIACEACHGPGAAHAAANQSPLRRYQQRLDAAGDDTIVQPTRLGAARSAQVCGQCHSVNILRQAHFDSWREEGLVYRPGGDLHASNLVVTDKDRRAPELAQKLRKNPQFFASAFWSDGQVRLAGREYNGLLGSPCYQRGHGNQQLDCSSCHQLHREAGHEREEWADDQLKPGHRGNQACTQCHTALREPAALAAHTYHAPESAGSNCYDCHMPKTSFGLMKATASHTITSPDVAVELATGRPNACNLCHLDQSLQWTADHLRQWYGQAVPTISAEQQEVAAGVRWLLTGDAGVRALAVAAAGERSAQQAAGTDWLVPYLARLLDDPYYAVRFGAARSLRTLPGGAEGLQGYAFLAEAATARRFGEQVSQRWQAEYRGQPRPAVLLGPEGLQWEAFARLYARRDDRPVFLSE
jgi:nitrate/TMAO reductase-like tetraheme cytochrome c subunit